MIILLDSLGRLSEAEEAAREALTRIEVTLNPRTTAKVAELEFHLANTLGKMERFEEAEKHFRRAIKLRPGNASYHSNLGEFKEENRNFLEEIHQSAYRFLYLLSFQACSITAGAEWKKPTKLTNRLCA